MTILFVRLKEKGVCAFCDACYSLDCFMKNINQMETIHSDSNLIQAMFFYPCNEAESHVSQEFSLLIHFKRFTRTSCS